MFIKINYEILGLMHNILPLQSPASSTASVKDAKRYADERSVATEAQSKYLSL
jgi:hypothetical protein